MLGHHLRNRAFSFGRAFVAATVMGAALCSAADAASIVGWWRMEQDNDAGSGFSVPNEVAGNALTGSSGSIEPLNGGGVSFFPNLPNGGAANASGLNGSPNINGSVSPYAGLDAESITVEFFGRTNEGDARFLLRQSGSTGLRVDQPNGLRVQYSTASGQVTLTGLNNYDANWDHFAFTYNSANGVGSVYINGVLAGSNDGPNGEALTWPALALQVGQALDGGGGFSGNSDPFMDELRIVDIALTPSQFLIGSAPIVPEPACAALSMLAVGGLAMRRRRTA